MRSSSVACVACVSFAVFFFVMSIIFRFVSFFLIIASSNNTMVSAILLLTTTSFSIPFLSSSFSSACCNNPSFFIFKRRKTFCSYTINMYNLCQLRGLNQNLNFPSPNSTMASNLEPSNVTERNMSYRSIVPFEL